MKVQSPHIWSLNCLFLVFVNKFIRVAAVPMTDFGFNDESQTLNSSNDSNRNNINRHAWPPMKHHDIWNDVEVKTFEEDGSNNEIDDFENSFDKENFEYVANNFDAVGKENIGLNNSLDTIIGRQRQSKVLHIFPVPVDGECLSDDGRRTGSCFNAYECRQKGGMAKGDCAMGFGVCCIFIADCNATISNNITYLVSPHFPSFMPNNFTSCSIKVKLMSEDVSQLRFDFNHFSLGQPNRRTGICDGDVFNVSGGPGGTFSLCGQNSGQHIYYDVGGRSLPRQTLYGSLRPPTLAQIYPNLNGNNTTEEQLIEINMNFAQRFLPIRLWEIRIAQIPFSQRAPAGCLQYHSGSEGFIQTFNFADNGRHLANQHYRVCMRQETEMCSIMYQPCDEQSFRIGPNMPIRETIEQSINNAGGSVTSGVGGGGSGGGGGGSGGGGGASMLGVPGTAGIMNAGIMNGPITNGGMLMMPLGVMASTMAPVASAMPQADDVTAAPSPISSMPAATMASMATQSLAQPPTSVSMPMSSAPAATMSTLSSPQAQTTMSVAPASTSVAPTTAPAMTTTSAMVSTQRTTAAPATSTTEEPVPIAPAGTSSTLPTSSSTLATSPLSDDVEGSGDDGSIPVAPSRRPRPVSGGFDLLGFLRSAFDIGLVRRRNARLLEKRKQRQIFSTCSDRITLPCIIEDFIGTGFGPLPSCEPVHCGNQFCSSGVWPCRIESTVTPFFLNIHFGDGVGKGSAEDNIGACLRYTQMQCL